MANCKGGQATNTEYTHSAQSGTVISHESGVFSGDFLSKNNDFRALHLILVQICIRI